MSYMPRMSWATIPLDAHFRDLTSDATNGSPCTCSTINTNITDRKTRLWLWLGIFPFPNCWIKSTNILDNGKVRETGTPSRKIENDRWPDQPKARQSFHQKPLEQVHLCVGFKGLATGHPDRYAAHILNTILGGGVSSRLFQEVREKRGLAYTIYSHLSSFP